MKLYFCCEAVFKRYQGKFYSTSSSFGMELWERYLKTFDSINITARIEDTTEPTEFPLNDYRLSFTPLLRYKGLKGTVLSTRIIKNAINGNLEKGNAYILRVPGHIGWVYSKLLRSRHIPYGVEVVGDPWDVMGSIGGKFSFLLKRVGRSTLRSIVKGSTATLYVTQRQLQKRYPTRNGISEFIASNVKVNNEFYSGKAKKYPQHKDKFELLAVGSLDQLYKAPDIVIMALRHLKDANVNVKMAWLGGGKYLEEMRSLAQRLGVEDMIDFKGSVSRDIVESFLDKADLFIHVSRTEGLPRAVIEAMAKGLPVIGTRVGGIPELLTENSLIDPDDAISLAEKIKKFIAESDSYDNEAQRNYDESLKYEDSILQKERQNFYNEVKSLSGHSE